MLRTVKKVTFTMTPDTIERLEQYAYESHSSKSKALTDLIWGADVKGDKDEQGQKQKSKQ